MKVYVSQIYIEAGASFPFSHNFQRYIHARLSSLVDGWGHNYSHYGSDFDLVFNMSSKSDLAFTEIKGPTVFKRDKSVEYSIFLPFNLLGKGSADEFRMVLRALMDGIVTVLDELGVDTEKVKAESADIVETIANDPAMYSHD